MNDEFNDHLWRFMIDRSDVRGQMIRLSASWQEVLRRREYPAVLRRHLGHSLCAISLLGHTTKFQRSIILQVTGSGPARMLVTQATAEQTVRGLATWRGQLDEPATGEEPDLAALFGRGRLVMTIDPGREGDQYQSVVPLEGKDLGAVLEGYFELSEQLPTRFWFAADDRVAVGLMLQRLPRGGDDPDAWDRCVLKAETVQTNELLDLLQPQVLLRLFGEERLLTFAPQPYRFACQCSRERIASSPRMRNSVL